MRSLPTILFAIPSLVGLTLSCNEAEPVVAPPTAGAIHITISTAGPDQDLDGYAVRLDGDESLPAGGTAELSWTEVPAGDHTLLLEGLAPNCDVGGDNPHTVRVKGGETIAVLFQVTCSAVARILFLSQRGGQYGIYTANLDGSAQVNLTADVLLDADSRASWSPDGRSIAFLSARASIGGYGDLYTMNADGSGKRNLTGGKPEVSSFLWAPDGRLAFSSPRLGGVDVFVINADGTDQRMLTIGSLGAWSPDGSQIAFRNEMRGISIIDADGSGRRDLTNPVESTDRGPRWSPDGMRIAFTRNPRTTPGDDLESSMWLMNADGSNSRPLTDILQGDIGELTWSHDGRTLAFSWAADIHLINPDGSGLTNLTNTSLRFETSLDWSSDDSRLVFSAWDGSNAEIFVIGRDGSQITNLTRNASWDVLPRWRPGY